MSVVGTVGRLDLPTAQLVGRVKLMVNDWLGHQTSRLVVTRHMSYFPASTLKSVALYLCQTVDATLSA
jgi:hypothetical protein